MRLYSCICIYMYMYVFAQFDKHIHISICKPVCAHQIAQIHIHIHIYRNRGAYMCTSYSFIYDAVHKQKNSAGGWSQPDHMYHHDRSHNGVPHCIKLTAVTGHGTKRHVSHIVTIHQLALIVYNDYNAMCYMSFTYNQYIAVYYYCYYSI